MICVLFQRFRCCDLSLIRNDLFGSKEDWRPNLRKPQSLSIPEFLFPKLFIRDFPMGGSVLKVVMGLAVERAMGEWRRVFQLFELKVVWKNCGHTYLPHDSWKSFKQLVSLAIPNQLGSFIHPLSTMLWLLLLMLLLMLLLSTLVWCLPFGLLPWPPTALSGHSQVSEPAPQKDPTQLDSDTMISYTELYAYIKVYHSFHQGNI